MSRFRPQIRHLIVIVSMGLFMGGSSAFSAAFELSPSLPLEQRINQRQAFAQDYAQNKYFQDNKVIVRPFSHTLSEYRKKKNGPLIAALNQTREEFQTKYACSISLSDLSIILQEADQTFRAFFYEDFLYEGKKIRIPKSKKFQRVCERLSHCFFSENQLKSLTFQQCQAQVLEIYQPLYQAFQEKNTVETASLGKNTYVNGMLNDSEFDLLYDISQIGKVFFEGFKAAPELVYYQMPLFNKPDESVNSKPSTSSTQNSNPTQNSRSPQNQVNSPQNQVSAQGLSTKQDPGIRADALAFEDEEIEAFMRKKQPQTARGNEEHLLFQNQCVFPENQPLENKQEQKSDFSLLFEPFDRVDQQESSLQYQQERFSDILDPRLSTELSAQDRRDLEARLKDVNLNDASESAKSCVKKCDARDKKGDYHYAFDERLICKMQCLCKEYSSPALSQNKPLVNKGALRVRFCTIPAEIEIPDTSSKNVFSIMEILNEIRKSTAGLYAGGRLSVQKMPQEVLDSKHSNDHSFAKTTFFGIGYATKTNPKLTNPNEQSQHNELFYQNLRAGMNDQSRNAFVVLGKEKKLPQQQENIAQLAVQSSSDNQETFPQKKPLDTVLQTQHTANMYLGFLTWIEENEAFLQVMEEQLDYATKIMAALNVKR